MKFMGEIDDYESLIWTRRYQEPGEFQITALATEDTVSLLKNGFFVWVRGEAECAMIESVSLSETEEGAVVEASGRFTTALFDFRRIIGKPWRYRATAEKAFKALIEACSAIFSDDDGVTLKFADPPEGSTSIQLEATYRNLLSYLTRLAKSLAVGIRLRPDFTNKTMTFEAYAGKDTNVVFSTGYENLYSCEWEEDRQEYRNVCYVTAGKLDASPGDMDAFTALVVGEETSAGLLRRETRVESKASRQPDEDEAEYDEDGEILPIPEWQFLQIMREDGTKALEQDHIIAESAECEVDHEKPFVYGTDWDLGDTVILRRPEWELNERKRVVEVNIVCEQGKTTITPVLGDPLPETIEWEDSDG